MLVILRLNCVNLTHFSIIHTNTKVHALPSYHICYNYPLSLSLSLSIYIYIYHLVKKENYFLDKYDQIDLNI